MNNNVAIITGASHGIGAATAKLLAKNNYAVVVNYNNSETEANAIVNNIIDNGGKAIVIQADISQENAVVDLFNKIDQQFGPVTALVNNAGINGGASSIIDITTKKLTHVFATNVFGTIYCCREALKRMKTHRNGAIVNVSSAAATFGGTSLAHYAASKAAVNTFTIACAREAAEFNVRVNAISPGVIDTGIHTDPNRLERLMSSLPMNRMGMPEEVAETILWLLSDQSSYISGAILPITGAR